MAQRPFWTATALTGVFTSLLPAVTMAAPLPSTLPASQLDWHAWGANRPAGELCSGYYLMPSYSLDAPKDPSQVNSQSDNASYSEQGLSTLNGNVILRKQNEQLQATKATLNSTRTGVALTGPLTYRQPNTLLRGSTGNVSLNSDAADVEQAHYVFDTSHARGDADSLQRLDDGRYMMRNATYTTCDPQSSLWMIQGDKIVINRAQGYGVATGTKLRIHNVPVFYWPWMRFPIDKRRLTGLLYPTISYSSHNGLDYAQPIYLNLAPNYDATITPRLMTDRGFMLGGQFRYLYTHNQGSLQAYFMPHDQSHGDGSRNDDFKGDDRWFVNYMHDGSFNSRTTYSLRYGAASDGKFFHDFGNDYLTRQSDNLERRAQIDYQGNVWHLEALARGYQVMENPVNINDKPFNQLPSLTANAIWRQSNGFYEEFNSNATYFERGANSNYFNRVPSPDDWYSNTWDDFLTSKVNGARVNVAPAIGFNGTPSWGFFKPRAQMYLTQYELDWRSQYNKGWDKHPTRTIPVLSVDTGLNFTRNIHLFGHGYRQTLTPRLFYAYVPYRNQNQYPEFDTGITNPSYDQLWSPYRFNGIDRIGDVNKISYGVSSSFFDDATGFQRFQIQLGQSHYFQNRRVTDNDPSKDYDNPNSVYNYYLTRKYSPAIGQFVWNINNDWSARYAIHYDTQHGQVEQNDNYLTYHNSTTGNVLNLGQRWVREGYDIAGDRDDRYGYNRNEFDVSFAWHVTPAVSFIGRYLYDQTNKRGLDKLLGVQVDDCCYAVQLAWRKYIDEEGTAYTTRDDHANSGIFLRFVFKGLGGLGQNPNTAFQQAVPNYRPERF